MLGKLFRWSEIKFAILFIIIYVVGNSVLDQVSINIGMEKIVSLPFNILLLVIMLVFIIKEKKTEYYGLCSSRFGAKRFIIYIPLAVVATVNIWFGVVFEMEIANAVVYFVSMLIAGALEELIFRGFLYKAMCRKNVKSAIILTSILFGAGHIVNMINGSGMGVVENVCQLFYAMAIGFMLVAVLYTGKSLIPCIVTHSVLNALSIFSNEAAFEKVQIPVCIVLCVISLAVGAVLINHDS